MSEKIVQLNEEIINANSSQTARPFRRNGAPIPTQTA